MAKQSSAVTWQEIQNRPDQMQLLQRALHLLQDTFVVGQYDHLTMRRLTKMMIPRLHAPGVYLLSLRVWVYGARPDIAAFFFLRKRRGPVAYCLSPGAQSDVAQQTLQTALEAVCTQMRTEMNSVLGSDCLEVVTELDPNNDDAPHFFDSTANLSLVFNDSISGQNPKLIDRQQYDVGDPWPDRVHRWTINI